MYNPGDRVKQVMKVELLGVSTHALRGKILRVIMQVDDGRTTIVETDAPFIGDTGTVVSCSPLSGYPGLASVCVDFDSPHNCRAVMLNLELIKQKEN